MHFPLRLTCRLGCLATVGGAALWATWWLTADSAAELLRLTSAPAAMRTWDLDRLMVDLASAALLAAAIGWATMSVLSIVGALVRERAPRLAGVCVRATPRCYRRLLAASLGLGVGLTVPLAGIGPGLAAERAPACGCRVDCPPNGPRGGLFGLGLPDLPSSPTVHPTIHPTIHPTGAHRLVVVGEGDSLWRLAGHQLGPGATTADIATATSALYAANRSTIGNDPDLIQPGMRLTTPEGRS